ncbi:hypothetical protein DES51_105236 [Dielma fastidiosa]|uniref:Uncharacterized protein n=1 Tax=Dielma fastidiosa TaxID=1034346 RepID=A0A318KT15_9FIRM|nr:hypothetical protein DES51_105236 [Dielma fastidiosa]
MFIVSLITFLIVGLSIWFVKKFTPEIKSWYPYYAITIGILFLIVVSITSK